ncbi:MAG: hypothetical protein QNI87_04975 [Erythrobacter sp.]|uniref:hypothetical protein n=1 Tax=Erythrobacter sp. TaxID=1042 RepID=UPI00260551B6|nr:hypothetical protein [Erythrobacter sp.]MDJ0977869.1 hypothetical protein [Erythrobacter sp.]
MDLPRRLPKEEYLATFSYPMEDVTETAEELLDIWPYVDAIKLDELGIEKLNDVHYVYRQPEGHYEHVLIGTSRFNSLLAIVIDRKARTILGHHLVDLNKEFNVSGGHLREV